MSLQQISYNNTAKEVRRMASSELNDILNRRQKINDALENGEPVKQSFKVVNVYTEFHEFSRKQIKDYQGTFNK